MTTHGTCGTIFKALVETWFPHAAQGGFGLHPLIVACPHDPPAFAIYALGFMAGQAEKVANGACEAFLVRPSPDWMAWTQDALAIICRHYGLGLYHLGHVGELWGYREEALCDLEALSVAEANTPWWHSTRARLCGIPQDELDMAYHKRAGWHSVRSEPDVEEAR